MIGGDNALPSHDYPSNQDELTNSTYVTLKLDDKGRCKIHNVSDGDREIVTTERYVVMPWKMVTRDGENMTLAEAVDGILSRKKSEAKERETREREREKKLGRSAKNTMRPI